jgi:putative membrane protein
MPGRISPFLRRSKRDIHLLVIPHGPPRSKEAAHVTTEGAGTGQDVPLSTKLALDRTRLAHDRTLLAWVRTATSLISFGFTIYKFFQYLREKGEVSPERYLIGPREFALVMISIGLFALLIATLQHRRDMRTLREEHPGVPRSLATVLAALISGLGILALISVIFRH